MIRRLLAGSVFVVGAGIGLSVSAGPAAPAPALLPISSAAVIPIMGGSVSVATYQDKTFEAGSLIIPMDECHQYAGATDVSTSRTAPRCYCPSATADDGVIKAYGLIYRLLENGITVSISISDAKTEIAGTDFSITAAEPVKLYNRSTNTSSSFFKRGLSCANPSATTPNVKIDYRGAPFIISAADAPAALALIKNGTTTGVGGRGKFTASTFTSVDVHVAQAAFTARIARTYKGAPKPIALLNLDGGSTGGASSGISVLTSYLNSAGLNTTGAGGTACAPGTVYGTFSSNADFLNDCLVTKEYATLWAPHWDAETNTQLPQVLGKISSFVDSGKALFAECASIMTFEAAFNPPSWDASDYTVAVNAASYKSSTRRITASGKTYPYATVVIKSAANASACNTTLATVTASSSGSWSWTSNQYSSASAAPCRISIDSEGTSRARNVTNRTCSPASSTVCAVATSYQGPTCGTEVVDTVAGGHHLATNGLVRNHFGNSGDLYGDGSSEGFVFRDVSNIYLQKGDLKFANPFGQVRHWKPAGPPVCRNTRTTTAGVPGDSVYKPGMIVERLISSCDGSDLNSTTGACLRAPTAPDSAFIDHDSTWDMFTYIAHKDGDPAKGPIIYLGGHDYNGSPAGVRLVLNTVFNLQYEVEPEDPPVPYQVVRSSPIVGPVDDVENYIQGSFIRYTPDEDATTFDPADPGKFVFPHRAGHLYGYDARNIRTTSTAYQDLGAPLWDAANHIPPVNAAGCAASFNGSCRTVFTTTTTGAAPARVAFDTAHRSAFGNLLGGSLSTANQNVLIGLILAGRPDAGGTKVATLGGVDRSTLALIESSPQAGLTRPKMIYVGGIDGMLHAICAERRGACDVVGRELWAYIPRTQLGQLRQNNQKLQGSPKVADFLGNFDGQPGLEWRTVLAFQTGSGNANQVDAAPSVIAMDVTNPAEPAVLWEVSTPATRGVSAQGKGLDIALGPVRVGGEMKPGVFVSTNNGGTGASGVYVNAYSAIDGSQLWASPWTHIHPNPRTTGNPAVPASGIPGGLALYDEGATGSVNRIAVPTLYGDLWVLDATTGTSIYGNSPVFRFSADKKPIGAAPAIYKDGAGSMFAVVVSGGYVDDDGASWSAGQQYIASVKLDVAIGNVPFDERGADSSNRPFVIDITGNAYAQPTIAGGELFVLTATTDINDLDAGAGSGSLYRVNLTSGSSQTYAIGSSGGSSVDFSQGVAYVSGVVNNIKIDVSSDFDANGSPAELQSVAKGLRRFWLAD